jgi:hypothetical protein
MNKTVYIFTLITAFSLHGYAQQAKTAPSDAQATPLLAGQWSVEKINEWYSRQPWPIGCNFLPSTAINSVEMWQDETFDLPTIDRELGLAEDWGMNSIRVFLNYAVWEAEAEKLKSNFRKFLDVAEKHGISVMPVLFDECNWSGGGVARAGKQPEPVPGVHNSGWVSSPSLFMLRNQEEWPKLKKYMQDLIGSFASDKRIIVWDLYNEPEWRANEPVDVSKTALLIRNLFAWAREMNPAQPLTVGAHENFDGTLSLLMRSSSDIVSFHAYDRPEGVARKIKWSLETGRPALCTEWLIRPNGNIPETLLPVFHANKVGAYNWGLVGGRTQTYYPWGSPKGAPEPKSWSHDLIRRDGTPYDARERSLFRKYALGEETTVP